MENKSTRSEAVRTQKKYLSIPEAAQEYGGSLGFWRKRVFLKQIPYVKAGRSVRLSREDLEAWHAARKVFADEARHVD
jgi:excisionase family DNA binding protein